MSGHLSTDGARDAPELVTRDQLYERLHAVMREAPPRLSSYERDIMAQAAAQEALASLDLALVFDVRPGLVVEMLRFYDQLRRQGQKVARFEELLTEHLSGDAEFDRGAARMLQQTALLAETFRGYERRVADSGSLDEHALRERLLAAPPMTAVRSIVVTVADWIAEPAGLYAVDFDLLSRLPGIETIDLIATEPVLASGFHQRLHDWLPGLEEVDATSDVPARPTLVVPAHAPDGRQWFVSRDREEELIAVARRVKADRRGQSTAGQQPAPLEARAVVYKRPLPYLYLAREVFGGAGIPYQTSDAMPLAAEPFAAALDLVFEFVATSFTRDTLVALLRSPHFAFEHDGRPLTRESVSALDRALSEDRYLGGFDQLVRLTDTWQDERARQEAMPAMRAGIEAAKGLSDLQTPAAVSAQIARLLSFLRSHAASPGGDVDQQALARRSERARLAITETLDRLAAASRAHGDALADGEALAAAARRWIEEQTFEPDSDPSARGVHLLDEDAARYGDFEELTLVGLIEGEWPERPHRNVFYQASLLRALGWPSERDWRAGAEARFVDLLGSAGDRVWLSTIMLDDEALVEPSTLLEEVPQARLRTAHDDTTSARIFIEEALSLEPAVVDPLDPGSRSWAELRLERTPDSDPAFHGQAGAPDNRQWSVSAVETYLQCPFKFFARHVLRLEEEPDDEEVMDPRTQGELLHKVFENFFKEWQRSGHGAVTPDNIDEARQMFEAVVERSLDGLSDTEAALERTRLLGSPAAAGLGEAVLRMEAERPTPVVERLLEYDLKGTFTFRTEAGPRDVPLRGKADRLDLLADGTFRLIDYKSGSVPQKSRTLQLPVYSLCAEQKLRGYRGRNWTLGEAAYVAFRGSRRVAPLFSPDDRDGALREAQERLVSVIDNIARGAFPPRPIDVYWCETCEYSSICRKDYVDDV